MSYKRMAAIAATLIGAALAGNHTLVVGRAATPDAALRSNNEVSA
jgi:hypothetical protein